MTCTSCSRAIPEGGRFCPHCGTAADAASVDRTRTSAPQGASPSDLSDHGRFIPGTMLGGRYRVVGLLGRGGMGEVYRADDLELGQAVALGILPAILPRSSWHSYAVIIGVMIILAIVGYAFVVSLGGRPTIQRSILPE